MRYSAVYRELKNRLDYFSRPGRELAGLTVLSSGEWNISGANDKPSAALLDFSANESPGNATASITVVLVCDRQNGFVQTESSQYKGVIDWIEAIADALETAPETGLPDHKLTPHDKDGKAMVAENGTPFQPLLIEDMIMSFEQDGVNESTISYMLRVTYKPSITRRKSRRTTPTPPVKSQGY